jgi:hypothetical protein
MNAFIINFNRLTYPRQMAEWLFNHGVTPVFIDNHSNYPPLLEYYKSCPFEIVRMPQNYGHTVVWLNGLEIKNGKKNERYIVTDPDLDLSRVPDDFLHVMNRGLDLHCNVDKCGLSLEINDLPNSPEGNYIRDKCEPKYWQYPAAPGYWYAATDTTFALYRATVHNYSHSAIRCDRPYTARHLSWYYTDLNNIPDDEKYYFQTANESASGKKRMAI